MRPPLVLTCLFALSCLSAHAGAALAQPLAATGGLRPNLAGQLAMPLRYAPDHGDFVIRNGVEFFNRSLFGGNTAFRVDGGDKPEFSLYLPGRGGNLRLGVQTDAGTVWLHAAGQVVTRYRPGELIYELRDPAFGPRGRLTLEVLALADTEGVIVRATGTAMAPHAQLVWAYGGVNGERGVRDGDIGTERVPISAYFQFQPRYADDNRITLSARGFTLASRAATIAGVLPAGARQHLAPGAAWNALATLLAPMPAGAAIAQPMPAGAAIAQPVVVGSAPLPDARHVLLALQRVAAPGAQTARAELDTYREVGAAALPATAAALAPRALPGQLPALFAAARKHFAALRERVRIDTPDPYLDAAMGALNVVGDALWDSDQHAIMHGAIAWRTKLLGWRGPDLLDALGWHARARENFGTWLPRQDVTPLAASLPAADANANLARNEAGLHSNGDLSHSHYDMNMVFIDSLLRHLQWTGDVAFARAAWPQIARHLAWERRLFRREYGVAALPLYESYATLWASDDLYYSGGGSSHASAFNAHANRMAARIATLAGADPAPYLREADLIEQAMRTLLWMPQAGAFAESKDLLGLQNVHPSYGLWTFYHTIDEAVATPREAWRMGLDLPAHLRAIPVTGPGVPADAPYHVFSETDWMPYTWSINNVVMDENMHTALALWQGGHAAPAYTLAKGALLASMFMGISPGNVGTMNYLDAYRRESQRDFGDSAGTMSRALVEGLFGVHPDALAGSLRIAPGFPAAWQHARLLHPDLGLAFTRSGRAEHWQLNQPGATFRTLQLRIPLAYLQVAYVRVNGKAAHWRIDPDAVGRPMLDISTPMGRVVDLRIGWAGQALDAATLAHAAAGAIDGAFQRRQLGAVGWWDVLAGTAPAAAPQRPDLAPAGAPAASDWSAPRDLTHDEALDLAPYFNDRVAAIFASGKYLSPRSDKVSLALPSQGIGAWAGHLKLLPVIDDSGLRARAAAQGNALIMPNGTLLATPGAAGAHNIAFVSQWDNYPRAVTVPLAGAARHLYLLMAGSTNAMQSRIDNGDVVVRYADGGQARLALANPQTWWPIEQDYFIDDYQFYNDAALPPRVDLKTGQLRLLDLQAFKGKGREVDGGAATVLELALDPQRPLQSLTVRALSNDVVIGLMSATLVRP